MPEPGSPTATAEPFSHLPGNAVTRNSRRRKTLPWWPSSLRRTVSPVFGTSRSGHRSALAQGLPFCWRHLRRPMPVSARERHLPPCAYLDSPRNRRPDVRKRHQYRFCRSRAASSALTIQPGDGRRQRALRAGRRISRIDPRDVSVGAACGDRSPSMGYVHGRDQPIAVGRVARLAANRRVGSERSATSSRRTNVWATTSATSSAHEHRLAAKAVTRSTYLS